MSDPQANAPARWSPARRNRLILVLVLLAIVGVALWAARSALLPFALALVAAYITLPVVNRIHHFLRKRTGRERLSRALAALIVFLLITATIILFVLAVVPVIGQQFELLWGARAELVARGESLADQAIRWYQENIPVELQEQVTAAARQLGSSFGRTLQATATRTFGLVTSTFSLLLSLIAVPFFLFYVLLDNRRGALLLSRMVPAYLRPDILNMVQIVDDVLSAYLRGQVLLCLFVGLLAAAGLMLLGIPYAALLGLFAGLTELIPFVGPILGAVPAVIIAMIQSPSLGLATLLLYFGIQQVENLLLVPRISGRAVQLHPAVVMVVLVIGNQLAGILGMLVAVPVTAILRDLFKYLYLRFQDQPLSPREALARVEKAPLVFDV